MKSLVKKTILNTIAIMLVSALLPGLTYGNDLRVLFTAAIVLALLNAFLRPFLKILLLPINIITLGLVGWFMNAIILYLVTLFVPGFEVVAFDLEMMGTTLVLSKFFSLILVSVALSVVTTLISWFID